MLQEFDDLVGRRQDLVQWWKLGSTTAKYDNTPHMLRVDVSVPTMVSFCGQAYAGAKNYHDAPPWFKEVLRTVMKNHSGEMALEAYTNELLRLDAAIELHREAVLEQLEAATPA